MGAFPFELFYSPHLITEVAMGPFAPPAAVGPAGPGCADPAAGQSRIHFRLRARATVRGTPAFAIGLDDPARFRTRNAPVGDLYVIRGVVDGDPAA